MAGKKSKSNEIKITRIYDAPVEAVWDAWTDPKQVAQWWGPRGFKITHHSKDLRPGGTWRYTMHGPDGKDWPNVTKYHEVEKYARLVYDHGGTDDTPPLFRVTALFTELKGARTQLDMTMTLATPEAAEETRKFIKEAGGNGTWDRLAEYLEKIATGKEKFVINRAFGAPVETLFEMWTDARHFQKWLAPTGVNMEILRGAIKPGEEIFYVMSDGKDLKMYGRVNYVEIKHPELLVYTQQFATKDRGISRHPNVPTWPETMLTTIQFASEGPDTSRVTVTWEPHGPCTAEELAAFVQMRGNMTTGWTGSFDKLEELLGGE